MESAWDGAIVRGAWGSNGVDGQITGCCAPFRAVVFAMRSAGVVVRHVMLQMSTPARTDRTGQWRLDSSLQYEVTREDVNVIPFNASNLTS